MEQNKRPKYFWEKDEFFGLLIAIPLFAFFIWITRWMAQGSFAFVIYFYIVLAFLGIVIGVGVYKKKG